MENASKSIKKNKKGTPRHAYWFLTFNNPPEDWKAEVDRWQVNAFVG